MRVGWGGGRRCNRDGLIRFKASVYLDQTVISVELSSQPNARLEMLTLAYFI